jgi:hypothetical protein
MVQGTTAEARLRLRPGALPACGRGTLRIIAAITHAEVLRTMLRHGTLAPDPPPLAPARACQDHVAWASPSPDSASSRVPWGPVVAEVRPRRVTRAACGEHERVRDVLRSRRKGFSGQAGGLCPHGGLSRGVFRVRAMGGHHAKCAFKSLSAAIASLLT